MIAMTAIMADAARPMAEIFRNAAQGYRASAEHWRGIALQAHRAGDLPAMLFAAQCVHDRLEWSQREDENMRRALERLNT